MRLPTRLALALVLVATASPARAHVPPHDDWQRIDASPPDYHRHPWPPAQHRAAPITRATVRAAIAGIDSELAACARDTAETGARVPRTLRVHLFWYPTGTWLARVGRVASPPLADEPTVSPLARCVSDRLSAAIGPVLPAFRALTARHLVHVVRVPR